MKKGTRCPKCNIISKRKTNKQFNDEFYNLVGDKYNLLTEYGNNNKEYVRIQHTCGYEFNIRPDTIVSKGGCNCPKCFGSKRDFSEEMFKLVGNEYSILYINKFSEKAKFKHNICGHEYESLPTEFLRGTRCPKCRKSRGEKLVEQYLIKNNYKYEAQYRFNDCRNKKPLPFDFAVFNNDLLICLIEFDGKQHYVKGGFGNTEIDFNNLKKRDQIKNKYCKDRNIVLIRICYLDIKNIEQILNDKLKFIYK